MMTIYQVMNSANYEDADDTRLAPSSTLATAIGA